MEDMTYADFANLLNRNVKKLNGGFYRNSYKSKTQKVVYNSRNKSA